jgi:hypothetical protein
MMNIARRTLKPCSSREHGLRHISRCRCLMGAIHGFSMVLPSPFRTFLCDYLLSPWSPLFLNHFLYEGQS